MKVLAVETSGRVCSVCIADGYNCLYQTYIDSGLTHSVTLVPEISRALNMCGLKSGNIDLFAASAGPGSFTGIRIGIAAVKALAWSTDRPCAAVSSLECLAHGVNIVSDKILCCVSDARAGRVYNALFKKPTENAGRLCADRVISISDLAAELKKNDNSYFLLGDAANICYNILEENGVRVYRSNADILPCAYGVARSALSMYERGEISDARGIKPIYLVKSQAERERLKRLGCD